MKATGKKESVKINAVACSIFIVICLFLNSCGIARSPEEEARNAFETFIKEMKEGNPQEGIRIHCRGQYKESMQNVLALANMFGESTAPFADYKGIIKVEIVPDYSDVALVVADIGNEEPMTYVLHLNESAEWKIYYAENKDLTLIKSFINNDMLQNIGIFTMSDSDVENLF